MSSVINALIRVTFSSPSACDSRPTSAPSVWALIPGGGMVRNDLRTEPREHRQLQRDEDVRQRDAAQDQRRIQRFSGRVRRPRPTN
jgi:hypothetical protein